MLNALGWGLLLLGAAGSGCERSEGMDWRALDDGGLQEKGSGYPGEKKQQKDDDEIRQCGWVAVLGKWVS